jgi:putative ABC transport system permease protein
MDNFFINVFSGFDLIDGIILNMKFGGWMISGFSLLVEDLVLLISCLSL